MEQDLPKKAEKLKSQVTSLVSIRVKRETKRRVVTELAKINKKPFGRKVTADELLLQALSELNERHVQQLQEGTLSNADRLERDFAAYAKLHVKVTKDEYLGLLLKGQVSL